MISARKLIAFFCLVAVLLASMTPASAGQFWAVLVPLFFVVGIVAIIWAERQSEENLTPTFSWLPVIASRAPPLPTS
jgi:hypothetical protein